MSRLRKLEEARRQEEIVVTDIEGNQAVLSQPIQVSLNWVFWLTLLAGLVILAVTSEHQRTTEGASCFTLYTFLLHKPDSLVSSHHKRGRTTFTGKGITFRHLTSRFRVLASAR